QVITPAVLLDRECHRHLRLRGSMWPGLAVPAPAVVLPQNHAALAGHARPRRRYLLSRVDRAAALALGGGTALDRYERVVAGVPLGAADTGDLGVGDSERGRHDCLRGIGFSAPGCAPVGGR